MTGRVVLRFQTDSASSITASLLMNGVLGHHRSAPPRCSLESGRASPPSGRQVRRHRTIRDRRSGFGNRPSTTRCVIIYVMDTPKVRYAERNGRAIAYQSWGVEGTAFLVFSEWPANADSVWEHPSHLRLWRVLGSLGQAIRFDRSGIGSSDPDPDGMADPHAWAEDAVAVMNEVGAQRGVITAEGWGTQAAVALAATHPHLVERMVLMNGYARGLRSGDYPIGIPQDVVDGLGNYLRPRWGTGAIVAGSIPGLSEEYRDWCARYERAATSPNGAVAMAQAAFRSDVRDVLGLVRCPTLVLCSGDLPYISGDACRYLTNHIVGAELIFGRSESYYDYGGESQDVFAFLAGNPELDVGDRRLAVVVFSDIVGSTEQLAERGDHEWVGLLENYDDVVERETRRFGGSVVKQTGDGHLLTFTSPGAAVSAILGIRRDARTLRLPLRFGMHMGEVEFRGDGDVAGITVHTASRIMSLADPYQILASSVIADLLEGTGLDLEDQGTHDLKGVPRSWRLFTVSPTAAGN